MSATQEAVRAITMTPTTAALPKNRFVKVTAGGEVVLAGNTEDAIGVSLTPTAATDQEPIAVGLLDGAKLRVETGAGITVGARVMSNAAGKAITATGATARVLGWALETSGGDGEIITILGQKAAGEFVS